MMIKLISLIENRILVPRRSPEERIKNLDNFTSRKISQYIKNGSKGEHPEVVVTASLIEKAMTKKHSGAVNKRAQKIWNDHFVSCALCHLSY